MKVKITLTIITCIGVILCFVHFFVQSQFTTYEFSPETSLAFFGRTPKEFFDTDYDFYDICEDFRKRAEINKNGNLILHLNREQEEAFLRSCDSQIEELKRVNGVFISDDYALISVTGDKNEVAEIIANKMSVLTVFDLANHQLVVNKTNPEEIVVEVRVVDENTGNCVYNAIWPKEEVCFAVKEWQFVEKTGDSTEQSGDGSVNETIRGRFYD